MLMLFPPLFLAFCGEETASFLTKAYQKHGALMHFSAREELPDLNEAHEAVLSAFFELADEVDKLRQLGENELIGYLITVTRNNAIDMRRRQKRWEKHCFYTDDPSIFDQVCADTSVEDEIIRQANAEMLYQALKQLPRRERTLLKRKYMDEAPDKEIAQELGVAPASVRTYLSRARNHLREIMEEMDK